MADITDIADQSANGVLLNTSDYDDGTMMTEEVNGVLLNTSEDIITDNWSQFL